MLKEERHNTIVEIVNKKGFIKNIELQEMLSATVQTIIADINFLDKKGKLIKVYGGAKSIKSNIKFRELFDEDKTNLNVDAKNKIANKAVELIDENELIFIDTGTTTKHMINYLAGKSVSIVTNGYSIALDLMEQYMDVCVVGGNIIPATHAIAGELSLKFIDNFHFDKAFIGMNGYDGQNFYTTNVQEAMIKEKVIQNSKKSYILMDSSKFNSKNRIKVEINSNTTLISENKIIDPKNENPSNK